MQLTGSVGLGGINRRGDAIVVQRLLENAKISPGPVDGQCGRLTIHAIEQFQEAFLSHPDGRVDVHGVTLRRLLSENRTTHHNVDDRRGNSSELGFKTVTRSPGDVRSLGSSQLPRPTFLPSLTTQAAAVQNHRADVPYQFWTGHTPAQSASVNRGLTCPTSAEMTAMLGDPRSSRTEAHSVTQSAGPFRVTGLAPAIDSLRRLLTQVHHDLPELYGILGTNGMRVIRATRGLHSWSNHSWGIAVDLLISGSAPPLGSNYSYRGLNALLPYFHGAGWYWGGGYLNEHRKDRMHFECGLALVRSFGL